MYIDDYANCFNFPNTFSAGRFFSAPTKKCVSLAVGLFHYTFDQSYSQSHLSVVIQAIAMVLKDCSLLWNNLYHFNWISNRYCYAKHWKKIFFVFRCCLWNIEIYSFFFPRWNPCLVGLRPNFAMRKHKINS